MEKKRKPKYSEPALNEVGFRLVRRNSVDVTTACARAVVSGLRAQRDKWQMPANRIQRHPKFEDFWLWLSNPTKTLCRGQARFCFRNMPTKEGISLQIL